MVLGGSICDTAVTSAVDTGGKEAAAGASVVKKDVEDVAVDEKKKVLVDEKKNVVVDEKKNTAAPVESNTVKKKKKKKMKKVGSYKEDLLILSGVLGLGLAAYWAWTSMSAPRRRRR